MKFTKFFISVATVFGLAACIQKEDLVMLPSAEDVVAPVLEAIEEPIEITPTNMAVDSVIFRWTPADYKVSAAVSYSIEAKAADKSVVILSGISNTDVEASHIEKKVTYDDLNRILFNDLGLADGVAEDVIFTIGAQVGNSAKVYSNEITVSCKVTAAEKVYPKMSVAGSYNGWTHDTQYLFDFAGDDNIYQAVIDFGEDHAANEFKITGGGWGIDEHSMNGPHDPESKTISLVAGGGDNINVYQAKRYYHLAIDKTVPNLTANVSFDQVGVIGDFNSWGADAVMTFNASKQRFYADVEFPADGGFKFRLDGDWAVSYGSKTEGILDSGDNIPVKAGNYRVYLNMNNFDEMTYELNAKMFGKDEPVAGTTPEPEPEPEPEVKGWGLVGEYNEWGNTPDVMLASDGAYLVAKGVELSGQVKFRKDGGWDVNFGAPGEVEPVEITPNAETELVAGGKNFTIAAGTYDVYLDEANAKAWFINDGSYPGGGAAPEASEWGIVGQVTGWAAPDVPMYKTETEGLFVAYNVDMPDGGFKIRANGEWNDAANYGFKAEGNAEVDHVYELICGGESKNITLAAGTYDIWFDLTNSKVYVMTPGKAITEAEGGAVEVQKLDYTNCQMELVGSGVAEQEGTTADTAWKWGNVLLASNEGKPAKEGDVYTWTWSGVALTADGWKIRTLNAATSGDVASFDLGDGAVDKTASPNIQESSDGNIYVTAGNYNITLVIDAAADTKTVTIVAAE